MSKKVLFVVTSHGDVQGKPTTGIWFSEFSEPYAEVLEAGYDVTVASPKGGPAPVDPRGYPSTDEIAGVRDALAALNATVRLDTVAAEDFDAIFLPGGHGPMFDLATDPTLKSLIADFWTDEKVVGSVCHGPASLLGVVLPGGKTLLHQRRVTAYTQGEDELDPLFDHMPFSLEDRMRREGAAFVGAAPGADHVQVDGRLVTGQNPASAIQTAQRFIDVIREH
ncbi:MAG: type 1 glutamine amidotransferase domain-containing protein [Acidobacteriota bacterium]